jgi:hypothetical protein
MAFDLRFHEMREISWQTDKVLFSQERRSTMEFFNIFFYGAATVQTRA